MCVRSQPARTPGLPGTDARPTASGEPGAAAPRGHGPRFTIGSSESRYVDRWAEFRLLASFEPQHDLHVGGAPGEEGHAGHPQATNPGGRKPWPVAVADRQAEDLAPSSRPPSQPTFHPSYLLFSPNSRVRGGHPTQIERAASLVSGGIVAAERFCTF